LKTKDMIYRESVSLNND